MAALNVFRPIKRRGGTNVQQEIAAFPMRPYRFALIFSLVPLSVFLVFSLMRQIRLSWTGPLWLVVVPFIAYQMIPGVFQDSRRLLRSIQKAWPATIVVMMLLYGATLHYVTLGLPGIPYPQNLSYMGWYDLGRQLERIEDEVERQTGKEPLVVGIDPYKTASGLAFYRTRAHMLKDDRDTSEGISNTTSRHLFGRNGLMYRYWLPSKDLQGANMIVVSDSFDELMKPALRSYFRKMGGIKELLIKKNGIKVGRYYYAVFEGYRSS
jgi:dolichol-phosphate mannosyltransferase